jgi:hypothetical protein
MALRKILILRRLAERGLEGRTTPIQTIGNFLTVSHRLRRPTMDETRANWIVN